MKIKAGVKKSVNYIAGRKEVFKGLKVDTRVQIRVERGGAKARGTGLGRCIMNQDWKWRQEFEGASSIAGRKIRWRGREGKKRGREGKNKGVGKVKRNR